MKMWISFQSRDKYQNAARAPPHSAQFGKAMRYTRHLFGMYSNISGAAIHPVQPRPMINLRKLLK
ncbi:hypothetical protein DPMN_125965 [Dreissena polymorpha]|uniref:Uncharacterized protein n=1 Tax=Dreissena polymorpha TaxID=45954 RepID=A0A9D4JU15_DREPO|nr:hypothetical protein DPMN_125965 [Dreissena polymorpha]